MKDEIETHPREPQHESERIGPPGTTQVRENLEGAPTEDSPAREATESIEKRQEAAREARERERD